ncbi:MAG TPA: HesA/MoeB/ThiF family protein, partial [Methanomassiliicoccales archaeon]|nr:HesA/MoeB/ThiF family protein [Methanomassiliicoccales archaeon]
DRYVRQLSIPGFGPEAQRRLGRACVAVVGVGGLGSAALLYLAAAGVGRLVLIDDQKVEPSNLNRQIIHFEEDALLPRYKVESARMKLQAFNSEVDVEAIPMRLEEETTFLLKGADLALDCMDGPAGRYLLNRCCLQRRIPLVHGAVEGLTGHVLTVLPEGPCLRCAFPSLPNPRGGVPVLGAAAGVIGSMQAMEAIKAIAGIGEGRAGRALFLDMGSGQMDEVVFQRSPGCPDCGSLRP